VDVLEDVPADELLGLPSQDPLRGVVGVREPPTFVQKDDLVLGVVEENAE
jgi:hypothetical protein